VLKYEHFRINIVVAAYPAFVYVVSRAGRQVDKNKLHTISAFVGFVIIIENTAKVASCWFFI